MKILGVTYQKYEMVLIEEKSIHYNLFPASLYSSTRRIACSKAGCTTTTRRSDWRFAHAL
jgi:hypothetical protein